MTHIEQFITWVKIKFHIHSIQNRPLYFNEREIWWCHLGENVGDEERGKGDQFMRPVIVIRKFNNNLALVVPTSSILKDKKYYTPIRYNGQTYSALISHLHTLDTKRLRKKIATLNQEEFTNLYENIIEIVFKIKIDPPSCEEGYMADANL